MLSIIDTHLLIASTNTEAFPPLTGTASAELSGTVQPEQLVSSLKSGVLGGAVLVQRGRTYGFDNALICTAAAQNSKLRAICAVDGRRGDCGPAAEELLNQPGVAGLRLMEPAKNAGLDWLSGPGAVDAWRAAAERGALMDVHVFPWNRVAALEVLGTLLGDFPQLRVILDNIGNPPVENGPPDFGVDAALRKVTRHERVSLKVSAMTFARLKKAGDDPAQAIVSLTGEFGAERLCWGSDVLAPGVTHDDALAEARQAVSALSKADAQAILSGNAKRLFDLS